MTKEEISIQYSPTRKHSIFTPNKFHTTKITKVPTPCHALYARHLVDHIRVMT